MAIAVRQVKTFTVSGEDGTVTVSFDSSVAAGSTLVVVAGAYSDIETDGTRLTSVSDTSSNTWESPTNVRAVESWAPNVFGAVAQNVASGSPTLTLNLSIASGNQVSGALFEVSGCVTSSGIDKTVTGTSTTSSISTSATGTLTQANNLVILCAAGWFGEPSNPSGWVSDLTQKNGIGGYLGCQVSHKTTSTTSSVTGTVSSSSAGASSALMYVIKEAAAVATLRYKFLLNASTFTSADTSITGYVWRNGDPDNTVAEKYTSLAGDATAGVLYITSGLPAGAATSDTIIGSFYNSTDGSRPFVAGTVEEV